MQILYGILRHILTGYGTAAIAWQVSHGANPIDAANAFNGAIALLAVLWSIWSKTHPVKVDGSKLNQ